MVVKKKKLFSSDAISSAISNQPDQQEYYTPPSAPAVAPATNTAILAGANPKILDQAKKLLGSEDYIGLCQRFVEKVTKGATGLFGSAIDAFNKQQDRVKTDFQNMPAGSQIFFAPDQSNGNFGHTGIATSNNSMISAQDNGVRETNLDQWAKNTGQRIIGYIPPQS